VADPFADIPITNAPVSTAPVSKGTDPFGDIPTTTHAAGSPWHLPTLPQHDASALRRAIAAQQNAAESPVAQGANAVLNATSNFGVGALNRAIGGGPFDDIPAVKLTESLKAGVHSVTHPGNAFAETHDLERKAHLPVAGPNAPWYLDAAQAFEDFGVQTAADPATYIPGLDVYSIGKRSAGLSRALARRVPGSSRVSSAVAPIIDRLSSGLVEGHDLKKSVTRSGENIVKAHEGNGHSQLQRAEATYADLVERNRPGLEKYETAKALLDTKYARPQGVALTDAEKKSLKADEAAVNALMPSEIRQAFLQRAYREGTPDVRRDVLRLGYKPTPEDRAVPPINRLHTFRDIYEPTQKTFKPEDLDATGGPIRVVRQGNKRGSFDLPKTGTKADDPLADRVLDRLVRGARIETYHTTRRRILDDLGLGPQPSGKAMDALGQHILALGPSGFHAAMTDLYDRFGRGEVPIERLDAEVARIRQQTLSPQALRRQRLLQLVFDRRQDALKAAEEKRGQHLNPDAPMTTRTLEFTADQTAQLSALRKLKADGDRGVLPTGRTKAGLLLGFQRQLRRGSQDTKEARGAAKVFAQFLPRERRVAAEVRRNVDVTRAAAEAVQAGERRAAERNAHTTAREAEALHGDILGARATVADRAAKTFPEPPLKPEPAQEAASPLLDAQGRPLGAQAPPLLDARGLPIRKPTTAERKQAQFTNPFKPVIAASERHARLADQRATLPSKRSLRGVVAPAERSARLNEGLLAGKLRSGQIARERLRTLHERNATIARAQADALQKLVENEIAIPKSLDQRLFGDQDVYRRGIMRAISDAQRDALFILPFAHLKNISVLAALGRGGLRTVLNGNKYAVALLKPTSALQSRLRGLEEIGATVHYIGESEPVFARFGIPGEIAAKLSNASTAVLERYDLGMRLALEDELRRHGIEGPEAGGEIRDTLGDYRNQSPAVKFLRDLMGANFPAWRLGIVPRAMWKALREQPRAVKAYARASADIQNDVTQPLWGANFDLGGPAEGAAQLTEQIGDMARLRPGFLGSPSTIGPLGLVPDAISAVGHGEVTPFLAQTAARYVPLSGVAESALNLFQSPAPWEARILGGTAGIEFPKHADYLKREKEMRRLGMTYEEVYDELRREGYFAPVPQQ
jgi:hypothetical protein